MTCRKSSIWPSNFFHDIVSFRIDLSMLMVIHVIIILFFDQKYSASLKIWAEKEFRNCNELKKQAFCAQLRIVSLIRCL